MTIGTQPADSTFKRFIRSFHFGRTWQNYLMLLIPAIFVFIFSYMPLYGLIIAFKDYNPALGFLDRFVYLDFEQLRLLPDFGSAQPTVQDRVSFLVSAQAYAIVFTAVRVLYEFWREKVLDVFL